MFRGLDTGTTLLLDRPAQPSTLHWFFTFCHPKLFFSISLYAILESKDATDFSFCLYFLFSYFVFLIFIFLLFIYLFGVKDILLFFSISANLPCFILVFHTVKSLQNQRRELVKSLCPHQSKGRDMCQIYSPHVRSSYWISEFCCDESSYVETVFQWPTLCRTQILCASLENKSHMLALLLTRNCLKNLTCKKMKIKINKQTKKNLRWWLQRKGAFSCMHGLRKCSCR